MEDLQRYIIEESAESESIYFELENLNSWSSLGQCLRPTTLSHFVG